MQDNTQPTVPVDPMAPVIPAPTTPVVEAPVTTPVAEPVVPTVPGPEAIETPVVTEQPVATPTE